MACSRQKALPGKDGNKKGESRDNDNACIYLRVDRPRACSTLNSCIHLSHMLISLLFVQG